MLQFEWGWTVVIDLFMSGFGGCLFAVIAILSLLGGEKFSRVAKIGAWAAFGAVLVGVFCLLADVGQPLRAMWMFGSFTNFDSWMPRGAWSLAASMLVFLLFALSFMDGLMAKIGLVADGKPKGGLKALRAILAILGFCLGLFVTVYTGCLLESSGNIPFWATNWLPYTFIAFSLVAGVSGAMFLVAMFADNSAKKKAIVVLSVVVLVAAVVAAYCANQYLAEMAAGSATAALCAEWVKASSAFTIGLVGLAVVALGAIVCVVLALMGKDTKVIAGVVLLAAIVAGIAVRYCVIGAGQHDPLPSIAAAQWLEGATFMFR